MTEKFADRAFLFNDISVEKVICANGLRGMGTREDPFRTVKKFYSMDGKFVGENDPEKDPTTAANKERERMMRQNFGPAFENPPKGNFNFAEAMSLMMFNLLPFLMKNNADSKPSDARQPV